VHLHVVILNKHNHVTGRKSTSSPNHVPEPQTDNSSYDAPAPTVDHTDFVPTTLTTENAPTYVTEPTADNANIEPTQTTESDLNYGLTPATGSDKNEIRTYTLMTPVPVPISHTVGTRRGCRKFRPGGFEPVRRGISWFRGLGHGFLPGQ